MLDGENFFEINTTDWLKRGKEGLLTKIVAKVYLRSYMVEISLFVAEINDDCLLGVGFLKMINLENVFDSAFGKMKLEIETNFTYCRIKEISERDSFEKVPTISGKPFVDNSLNLDETRKNIFTDFLCELEDVFSEDIVAGNCDVLNIKDSSSIKQVP